MCRHDREAIVARAKNHRPRTCIGTHGDETQTGFWNTSAQPQPERENAAGNGGSSEKTSESGESVRRLTIDDRLAMHDTVPTVV